MDGIRLEWNGVAELTAEWRLSEAKRLLLAEHYERLWTRLPKRLRLYWPDGHRDFEVGERDDWRCAFEQDDPALGTVFADYGVLAPDGGFVPLLRSAPPAGRKAVRVQAAMASTLAPLHYEGFSAYTLYAAAPANAPKSDDKPWATARLGTDREPVPIGTPDENWAAAGCVSPVEARNPSTDSFSPSVAPPPSARSVPLCGGSLTSDSEEETRASESICLTDAEVGETASRIQAPADLLPAGSGAAAARPFASDGKPSERRRILMLSWEFPPQLTGGLGRAVHGLSRKLAAAGHDVTVITVGTAPADVFETNDGVRVVRAALPAVRTPVAFLDAILIMNLALYDKMKQLTEHGERFDLLHAHDWLVAYAALMGSRELQLPLVTTIHATERGRNLGKLTSPLQEQIDRLERKLMLASGRIIACSETMKREIGGMFPHRPDKILLVPNGIEPARSRRPAARSTPTAAKTALSSGEHPALPSPGTGPLLFFLGRLVYEKGVHVLLRAMPAVLRRYPDAVLAIAGDGPYRSELERLAQPVGGSVRFLGFVDDRQRDEWLEAADLCVVPSLYEPFGIVALEAMASETPLVVSDTGGLGELVEHGATGLKAPAGDARTLTRLIIRALRFPQAARKRARRAASLAAERYNWTAAAGMTEQIYGRLLLERRQTSS